MALEVDEKHRLIAELAVDGVKQSVIAQVVGVSEPHVSRLLKQTDVAAAIRRARFACLESKWVQPAFTTLSAMIVDPNVSDTARVQACRIMMQAAGYLERDAKSRGEEDKPLQQMTTQSLRDTLAQLETELGSRAHLVNGSAQISPPAPSQALDIFD